MHRFITKQRCDGCKLMSFIRWRFRSDQGVAITIDFACSRCGHHGTVTLTKSDYQKLLNKRIPGQKEVDDAGV